MQQTPPRTASDVVTDFLASAPSLEALVAYRLPDDLQQRAHVLLDKNREGALSTDERLEMEELRQINHLLVMLKAKAALKLKAQS